MQELEEEELRRHLTFVSAAAQLWNNSVVDECLFFLWPWLFFLHVYETVESSLC